MAEKWYSMSPENARQHRIRWYVYVGTGDDRELIPHESTMRGDWPFEAKCSCGWETHEGGAVASWVRKRIQDHKFDVEHGIWQSTATGRPT